METLTGNIRHRSKDQLFGPPALVLQVERTYIHTTSIGGHIDCETMTDYRDATVEDLSVLGKIGVIG